MNKNDLINQISKDTTLTKSQIRNIVEKTFENITSALSRGEKFKMSGFGSFSVRKRAARRGNNPRTGEKILIEERIAPVFTPGKKLIEAVNSRKDEQ